MIGLIVVVIGMSFGGMHGYAINPARDFGPRLFTVVAGFKNNGLTDGGFVFWVPIVGPILGGLIGGLVYDIAIRRFFPRNNGTGYPIPDFTMPLVGPPESSPMLWQLNLSDWEPGWGLLAPSSHNSATAANAAAV